MEGEKEVRGESSSSSSSPILFLFSLLAVVDDFTTSSKELEEELERELASTEVIQSELQSKITKLEGEKEEWKVSFTSHSLFLFPRCPPSIERAAQIRS